MKGHVQRRGKASWRIKFDQGTDPVTGKRKTHYVAFKGTKRDAETEMARLITLAKTGDLVDPSRTTVSEFLDRWEKDWAKGNVAPKTFERYSELMRLHVRPHLGALPVQKVRAAKISELYSRLLREGRGGGRGLGALTVQHVHRVFHRALRCAVEWGIIQSNPASVVKPPRVEAKEMEILSAEQIKKVMDKLRGRSLHIIVQTALATGMRRGELLALQWKDLDLDRGQLLVRRSLEQTKAGGLRFKPVKTRAGRRSIGLPAYLVGDLRAHWKAQQEDRLALGQGKAPDDSLVFATKVGETRSPASVTKEWKQACDDLGLHVRFHDLRHTSVSELIAANVDILTISRRVGHSSPSITLNCYGHLLANADDRAAQIMQHAYAKGTNE